MEEDQIYYPKRAQLKQVTRVLARAFQKGPIYVQFLPDEKQRRKKLPVLFGTLIKYTFKYGEVTATSKNLEGVMCCLPSESGDMTLWRMFRCGGWRIPLKGLKFMRRLNEVNDILNKLHEKHAPFPHTHLLHIGVEPDLQRRGYGGKLLRHLIAELDAHRRPCYLETAKPENVPLYEHFGFETLEKQEFPERDFMVWAMLRKTA